MWVKRGKEERKGEGGLTFDDVRRPTFTSSWLLISIPLESRYWHNSGLGPFDTVQSQYMVCTKNSCALCRILVRLKQLVKKARAYAIYNLNEVSRYSQKGTYDTISWARYCFCWWYHTSYFGKTHINTRTRRHSGLEKAHANEKITGFIPSLSVQINGRCIVDAMLSGLVKST